MLKRYVSDRSEYVFTRTIELCSCIKIKIVQFMLKVRCIIHKIDISLLSMWHIGTHKML